MEWKIEKGKWKIIFLLFVLSFSILNSQFSSENSPRLFSISSAKALDSTPSADIKAKLEELKKEIASKAAKLKQEVNRKLKDKAYVGKVKSKSDSSLTLATDSGPKIVSINQDTVFENNVKSKQKFSEKTIALENYIAALGDSDETGVLTARKIVLLAPLDQPKAFLWGQIISISDQLITLKTNNAKNVPATIASSNAKLNDFVILTGSLDKNEIFKAGFAYVIPQGGIIKPKKIATPSAQPTTTPKSSASPSTDKRTSPKPTSR